MLAPNVETRKKVWRKWSRGPVVLWCSKLEDDESLIQEIEGRRNAALGSDHFSGLIRGIGVTFISTHVMKLTGPKTLFHHHTRHCRAKRKYWQKKMQVLKLREQSQILENVIFMRDMAIEVTTLLTQVTLTKVTPTNVTLAEFTPTKWICFRPKLSTFTKVNK